MQMQSAGVRLAVVCYCCIGALFGQLLRGTVPGTRTDWLPEHLDVLALALLGNFFGLTGLVLFFRRGLAEPPLGNVLSVVEGLVRGIRMNNRLAFAVFALAWLLGVFIGLSVRL